MSLESAAAHLARFGRDREVVVHEGSSHSVAEAAAQIGVPEGAIAKTISLYAPGGDHAVLVVAAGDVKIASGPFKQRFGVKAAMLRPEDVEPMTGHRIGGVCPFANPETAEVWLDVSLKRFDVVHPAAGSSNSSIALTPADLEEVSGAHGWIDVCKPAGAVD